MLSPSEFSIADRNLVFPDAFSTEQSFKNLVKKSNPALLSSVITVSKFTADFGKLEYKLVKQYTCLKGSTSS